MKSARLVRWFVGSSLLAITSIFWIQPIEGQAPVQAAPLDIQSLAEPDQGFIVNDVSPQTGFVTFAASPRDGMLLPVDAAAPAQERALRFVELYGARFGLTDASQLQLLAAPPADLLGLEHVKFQQVHNGVPVRGAEFIVHLKGSRAMAANGHIVKDLPASVIPEIAGNVAQAEAATLIAKHNPAQAPDASYSEPRLEILNRALLSGPASFGSRLAWFIEATGPVLREYLWVDAQSGAILLNFSQLADAKSRKVYTANSMEITLPGTLVRSEGDPATGDSDTDKAYDFAGVTYDYYFTNHGRDSFDNAGGQLISTVHYCKAPNCPNYANAFWNGTQMVYGNGYASADDVVGHELTHAVTERSAGLLYYVQSGALNESFSDIFGETIDLTDAVGTDTAPVRWDMGEDLAGGAIRNMMDPTTHSDPGKMSDSAYFVCSDSPWTDDTADRGGVHTNSGIPNHAFALMADGGSFNGKTITGIGLAKAAKIQYRALTAYLTSGATFLDDYNALIRSCSDLVGTLGITSADCTQVTNALQAVEMNATWACTGATPAPALCSAGTVPSSTFSDGFEAGLGNWTTPSSTTTTWQPDQDFEKSGVKDAWGPDPDGTTMVAPSDHQLTLTNAVTIPAGGRLYFDHAFEFENAFFTNYDGGVLEYSAGGGPWTDAGSLIDAGQNYRGTAQALGTPAFVATSFGYTGTRLNLASLAGQNVKFRFRIVSDAFVGSLGWVVDNVNLYTCVSGSVPGAPTGVSAVAGNAQATVSFTPPASDGGSAITSYTVTSSPGGITQSGSASPITVTGLTNGTAYTFTVTATNAAGTGPASSASAAVTPTGPPGSPTGVSAVRGNAQATVSFTAPANNGGSAITSYTATASPGGATASGSASPLTVTGLTNGTAYTFTVTATNAIGTSAPSAPSAPVTPATVPSAPTGVSGTRGNGQVTVSFTAPNNGGDAITSYTVTASPGGATASGSSSPITVTGLTNGTAYTFTVKATNGVGTGPSSAASTPVTPATVPGAPTGVSAIAGNAQAAVSFAAPASNGGDPITSYTVTASPGGATATGSGSPITVTGLTNGTSYTFTVRATNGVGSSAASAASSPVTPTAAPGTPLNFTVTASGLSLLGTWTSTGGAATSHTLQVATSASFSPVLVSMPLGPGNSFSLEAPPGTAGTFFFRLIATNSFGSSAPTAGVSVSLPGPLTPPGAPVLNNAVVSGSNVSLSWTPGAGGAPSSYLLLVGSSPGASNIGAFPMGTFTSISATAPDGTYFARVQASNAAGTATSNEISFTVGTPCVAPSAPTSVSVGRAGNVITVSWAAPATGSGPLAYMIFAGTSAGASNLGAFEMGSATTVSAPVPPGTYFIRLRASNACGVSGDSAEVSVVVP